MGDVVNLRRFRKEKSRAEADQRASANRALHGRTRAERERLEAEQDAARRHIDGHRLDDRATDPDSKS